MEKGKIRMVAIAVVIGAVVLISAQISLSKLSGEITIAGSTTVLPINQECARLLMEKYPDLKPVVIGKDSVAIVVHPSNE
ncbi:MAG: hypothetical protein ACXQTS_01660, partial [Candidatus Methanospirareceae archaeon]